ncbi:unnamed protein product [Gongylonema pulchrum]|uniref:Uncharacterized protein n=1 Tax=Gongylonema pulchrum TaxID=637853 RepID=A0A3P7P6G2_9BILA|nr:unnamed protein product [Gongylonema pulchrum]
MEAAEDLRTDAPVVAPLGKRKRSGIVNTGSATAAALPSDACSLRNIKYASYSGGDVAAGLSE